MKSNVSKEYRIQSAANLKGESTSLPDCGRVTFVTYLVA